MLNPIEDIAWGMWDLFIWVYSLSDNDDVGSGQWSFGLRLVFKWGAPSLGGTRRYIGGRNFYSLWIDITTYKICLSESMTKIV